MQFKFVCRGCFKQNDPTERFDAYRILTGHYCDECFENNYPYRKDEYFDPEFAGEVLEEGD